MYIKKDEATSIVEVFERNVKEAGRTLAEFNSTKEPYLDNLDNAVEAFVNFMDRNPSASIKIIGDYDVDGICATTIMYNAINMYGYEVETRLPKRFSEGYGLSEKIIDETDEGIIITVDNGIAAISAIKKAKEKGLYVIVIDHHLPPSDKDGNIILPNADVILDPHVHPEKSEFVDYCGAGLAYRFAKKLLPDKKLTELKMLASLATVADIMPLYGANRLLVKEGLEAFNSNKMLPGLKEIARKLELDNHQDEVSYGFKLGPIFNASGRLYDNGANRVLSLLKMKRDDPKLTFKVNNLIKANDDRKLLAKEGLERILANYKGERPIVVYDEAIGEGIIGLIAGRLTEQFKCPSIVFTKTEKEGIIKGSGRSTSDIHLKKALDKVQDKIIGYGGHSGAAGLSIEFSKLEEFKEAFKEAVGDIPDAPEDMFYDLELDIEHISELREELNSLAPFGEGNPKIIFHLECDIDPKSYIELGDGTHFKVTSKGLNLLGFGLKEKYEALGMPSHIDCIGYLTENWYNDVVSYNLELIDFTS